MNSLGAPGAGERRGARSAAVEDRSLRLVLTRRRVLVPLDRLGSGRPRAETSRFRGEKVALWPLTWGNQWCP